VVEESTIGSPTLPRRPRPRSVPMMGACGQLAALGFNLNKLVRELAKRRKVVLVG